MKKQDKEIKTMTLDLAKVISYLNELQKTNNQNYITPEGLAFLEGVVLAGNGKVKVISKAQSDREEMINLHVKSITDGLRKDFKLLELKCKPKKWLWF